MRENDKDDLEGLTASINEDYLGVRNAPLVRPYGDRYQIASGHRRVNAAKQARLLDIWCRIEELSDTDMMREGLVENAHRKNLKPEETFNGLERYRKALGLKTDFYNELSRRTGLTLTGIYQLYDAYRDIIPEVKISDVKSLDMEPSKPTVGVVAATQGMEKKEDRVKMVEVATQKEWGHLKTREVVQATKNLPQKTRNTIIESKMSPKEMVSVAEAVSKLPDKEQEKILESNMAPKTMVEVAKLKPEIIPEVIDEIQSKRLNEEDSIRTIHQIETQTYPQEIKVINEAKDVMEDIEKTTMRIVNTWGINQYGILGETGWVQAENLFTKIELHMKWLKNKGWAKQ